jgi:adenosylcobinamide-GDP ribazoletransferase
LLCQLFSVGILLQSALLCVLPVLVTGGIHLDGFCDTVDALSSHQPKERKLEILKDPHTGAFALLFCCVYFLLQFGLYTEIASPYQMGLVSLGFVLSRSGSVVSLLTIRNAKKTGTLYLFSSQAQRSAVGWTTAAYLLLYFAAITVISIAGGDYLVPAITAAGLIALLFYHRRMCYRQFGGITGDLAGWFLQVCELWALAAVVLAAKIGGMIWS